MSASDSYVGKYTKQKLLGKGTFGEAWLVVSTASGRSYVMKELMSVGWDSQEKDKNMTEVNILSSCNHLNIIRYAGAYHVRKGLETERILIIMEYADAGDLSMVVKRQRELKQYLPESDILSWFVQIALGLQYIHKKNILHRDLKTQNIFVTSKKLVKIGDFGISKWLSHTLDLATTAIGTPHYLSPEICRRQPYSHKSDMWSLGCVLYELCSLQLAFPAPDFVSLVASIVRGGVRALPKHFSQKLTDLVQVLLRPVPDRRPSAETLIQCAKLEKEVKLYLAYVNGMIKDKEAARVRLASAKAEEEKMLEEVEKSIKENLEEVEEEVEAEGEEEMVIDINKEEVKEQLVMKEEEVKVEDSVKVRDRVGSLESGYGSGKVEVAQQTSL